MSNLNVINSSLLSLTKGLHSSHVEFKLPEKGIEQLSTLVGRISGVFEWAGDEQFVQSKNALSELMRFLIYDRDLQDILLEQAREFWDELIIQLLRNIAQNDTHQRLHDLIADHSERLLHRAREYLFDSVAAYDERVLEHLSSCEDARELGLDVVAELRNRKMSLLRGSFRSSAPPPAVPNPSRKPKQPERKDEDSEDHTGDESDGDFFSRILRELRGAET